MKLKRSVTTRKMYFIYACCKDQQLKGKDELSNALNNLLRRVFSITIFTKAKFVCIRHKYQKEKCLSTWSKEYNEPNVKADKVIQEISCNFIKIVIRLLCMPRLVLLEHQGELLSSNMTYILWLYLFGFVCIVTAKPLDLTKKPEKHAEWGKRKAYSLSIISSLLLLYRTPFPFSSFHCIYEHI